MRKLTGHVFATALMAAALSASPALAQPGPGMRGGGGPGWMMGPGMMMGHGMRGPGGFGGMCDPRGAGLAEWRIQQIERTVKLTDEQREKLKGLQAASGKAADVVRGACPEKFPGTSSERMALMEKRTEAMLAAIKLVRPEFDAFYNSLDADQKAKLDSAGPRRWGWHGWRWNEDSN